MLDAAEFATIATTNPNGYPQLSVVWVERDPRVTVLVYPKDNPYSYVEVRGRVSMVEEGGRELIDRLNELYTGTGRYPGDDGTDNVRVVCRITPEKVVTRVH